MVVADVGAGTGFMAAGLAPLVHEVHVLDGSAAMLAVARRNLAAFGNVIFPKADGQALPLPNGSLDAIFANMYLHHCPGHRRLLFSPMTGHLIRVPLSSATAAPAQAVTCAGRFCLPGPLIGVETGDS